MGFQKSAAKLKYLSEVDILLSLNHEINSPLNAIAGFSELIAEELKEIGIEGKLIEHLEHVRSNGIELSELVNNIYGFSRPISNLKGFRAEKINIKLLIQTFFHVYKGVLRDHDVDFQYTLDPTIMNDFISDRDRLIAVINLLMDYLIDLENLSKIKLGANSAENGIVVSFQAFFKSGDEKNNPGDVINGSSESVNFSSLLEELGGELAFKSDQDYLRYEWVIKICSYQDGKSASIKKGEKIRFAEDQSVLIVDDNEMNRKMMSIIFDRLGLSYIIAENGKVAVEMAYSQKPDLILMDLEMPLMNGFEATKAIKSTKETSMIPMVVLSANTTKESIEEALGAGADRYLNKPVVLYELLPILKRFLKFDDLEVSQELTVPAMRMESEQKIKVLEGLRKLRDIPYYLTSQLSDAIQELEDLCNDCDKSFVYHLRQVEGLFFNRDHIKAVDLLDELIEELDK